MIFQSLEKMRNRNADGTMSTPNGLNYRKLGRRWCNNFLFDGRTSILSTCSNIGTQNKFSKWHLEWASIQHSPNNWCIAYNHSSGHSWWKRIPIPWYYWSNRMREWSTTRIQSSNHTLMFPCNVQSLQQQRSVSEKLLHLLESNPSWDYWYNNF